MATARINGAELFFVESGHGVPCIFLHGGLGFDHSAYKTTLTPLEDVFRFTYVDQRGNGRSERVPLGTITIPQLAEDVEALRVHLGLDRLALMGHSYGGFVALEYATRYPERLTHLLALDTSPGVFEPTPDELAERGDPSWITPEVQRGLDAFAGAPPATNEEFAAILPVIAPAYLRSTPPDALAGLLASTILNAEAMVRGFEVLDGWSVVDRLGRISCPALMLCGRYDLFTTPECSKRLASAIPGAELVFLERGGHFPWIEEPEVFFAVVKGWLARNRPL